MNLIKHLIPLIIKPVMAEDNLTVKISGLENPAKNIGIGSNIGQILTGGGFNLINLLFFLAGVVFFFSLVLAGWQYMFSSGDQKNIEQASGRLNNSIIGLVVVIAAFLITNLISSIIGANSIF